MALQPSLRLLGVKRKRSFFLSRRNKNKQEKGTVPGTFSASAKVISKGGTLMTTTSLYDTSALYRQHMNETSQRELGAFYRTLFADYPITTIHDCSIGAGGSTLPLAKLGYTVSGSDLSENLLTKAAAHFAENGFQPRLFLADFRHLDEALMESVDCIVSTGNSLPHVDRAGFQSFLRSASARLNDGGLLFFDIRNWDTIAAERPIIQATHPSLMTAEEHRSTHLLFNWHDDGSVTFSFASIIDKQGKHASLQVLSAPPYYPLLREDVFSDLQQQGYRLIQCFDMDALWIRGGTIREKTGVFDTDFAHIQWYGVLAQKADSPHSPFPSSENPKANLTIR